MLGIKWPGRRRNNTSSFLARGQLGEDAALKYLREKGYCLIERNWRCKAGEIDIIMDDGQQRIFVEVRARQDLGFGSAADSVTIHKQHKLIRAAKQYQVVADYWGPARFDVVTVDYSREKQPQIEHIEHAFEVA